LEKINSWKFILIFLIKNCYLLIPRKDAQATGEAFSPKKRKSSTSKDENSVLFSIFVGHFLSSWIRIRIRNLNADPYPDPDTDPDPKPCREGKKSGSWIRDPRSAGCAPACYGSSLGSNLDISQKYKMGEINKGVATGQHAIAHQINIKKQ
jgi:hypothetical protein